MALNEKKLRQLLENVLHEEGSSIKNLLVQGRKGDTAYLLEMMQEVLPHPKFGDEPMVAIADFNKVSPSRLKHLRSLAADQVKNLRRRGLWGADRELGDLHSTLGVHTTTPEIAKKVFGEFPVAYQPDTSLNQHAANPDRHPNIKRLMGMRDRRFQQFAGKKPIKLTGGWRAFLPNMLLALAMGLPVAEHFRGKERDAGQHA